MITLRSESDVTKPIKEFLADIGDCSGTFHNVGIDRVPCMGSGHLLSKCRIDIHEPTDNTEAIKFARSLGFNVNKLPETSRVNVRPTQILNCPCVSKSEIDRKSAWLGEKIRGEIKDIPNEWVLAHDQFHKKRKPVFINGGFGKDRNLALYLSTAFKGRIEVFHGVEFSDFLVKTVNDEKIWKPFGLYVVLNLDGAAQSDFTKRRISYLIRQAATGRPRLIFSSKLELADIASRFSVDENDKLEVYSALKDFYEAKV